MYRTYSHSCCQVMYQDVDIIVCVYFSCKSSNFFLNLSTYLSKPLKLAIDRNYLLDQACQKKSLTYKNNIPCQNPYQMSHSVSDSLNLTTFCVLLLCVTLSYFVILFYRDRSQENSNMLYMYQPLYHPCTTHTSINLYFSTSLL